MTAAAASTTTVNLIAFAEDPSTVQRLRDRFSTFAQKHSCRAIFLDATRSGATSEETELAVAGMPADQLRSTVHDLLAGGVGSALFWAGRDLNDPRFEALASLGTTVVVDSSRADDGKASLQKLAEINASTDRFVRDLSYLRLLPWQDMVAQFFDDAELAQELPRIAGVEVVSGSEPEAYYFAGWLASRLHWRPCGRNELCNDAGDVITVEIGRRGEPRRVLSVVLRSKHCTFSAELDAHSADVVCLTVAGKPERERRCAPLHDVDLVSLVEQAMFVPHKDAVFTETLHMARAILDLDR
ncbi:MAG TPA: glucose-6-phosphate dehydrogenase assembly protein OpcA [Candidatus Rubrimentiphilum sp.]|nr:glucose-6-phosphate dehydrogenase assembly protein OpcA [Candidatus Rubrimentiphilum sp.]